MLVSKHARQTDANVHHYYFNHDGYPLYLASRDEARQLVMI